MEHEVAKLMGAPPGYLGHRETQPMLTQQKLNAASSESCDLSLVLFDEIEKAAPSMTRLLLGVLDKGTLRLGDSTSVNFEKSIVFLDQQSGRARNEQATASRFRVRVGWRRRTRESRKLERIGADAVRKNFSPEFINRIDEVVTYQPLSAEAMGAILDLADQ